MGKPSTLKQRLDERVDIIEQVIIEETDRTDRACHVLDDKVAKQEKTFSEHRLDVAERHLAVLARLDKLEELAHPSLWSRITAYFSRS